MLLIDKHLSNLVPIFLISFFSSSEIAQVILHLIILLFILIQLLLILTKNVLQSLILLHECLEVFARLRGLLAGIGRRLGRLLYAGSHVLIVINVLLQT